MNATRLNPMELLKLISDSGNPIASKLVTYLGVGVGVGAYYYFIQRPKSDLLGWMGIYEMKTAAKYWWSGVYLAGAV